MSDMFYCVYVLISNVTINPPPQPQLPHTFVSILVGVRLPLFSFMLFYSVANKIPIRVGTWIEFLQEELRFHPFLGDNYFVKFTLSLFSFSWHEHLVLYITNTEVDNFFMLFLKLIPQIFQDVSQTVYHPVIIYK